MPHMQAPPIGTHILRVWPETVSSNGSGAFPCGYAPVTSGADYVNFRVSSVRAGGQASTLRPSWTECSVSSVRAGGRP